MRLGNATTLMKELEQHLPALDKYQLRGLAMWVCGTIFAGSGCQTTVASIRGRSSFVPVGHRHQEARLMNASPRVIVQGAYGKMGLETCWRRVRGRRHGTREAPCPGAAVRRRIRGPTAPIRELGWHPLVRQVKTTTFWDGGVRNKASEFVQAPGQACRTRSPTWARHGAKERGGGLHEVGVNW